MKKLVFLFSILMVSALQAQTMDFHSNVTNLWFQGQKSNVLEIANQRLNINTNDIAGLILKLEYEVEFLEFTAFSNTVQRVLTVGKTITSTNFVREFSEYEEDINVLIDALPHYPANEIAVDKLKALLPNKPLAADEVIKALQNDAYFQ